MIKIDYYGVHNKIRFLTCEPELFASDGVVDSNIDTVGIVSS